VERAHIVLQVALSFLLLLLLDLLGGDVNAQSTSSGDRLANDLRRNVVRVDMQWQDGSPRKSGFGFIVGERSNLLYIVTAYHVVRNDNLVAGTPSITFFQDQGKAYQGDLLLDTHLVKAEGDLAVIRVSPPPGFSWQTAARSSVTAERGDDVRFIGIDTQWVVPVRPGAVNTVEPNRAIRFEGLTIRTGTSGAPLVGDKGIVGMITDDDVLGVATPIDVIERAVRGWNYPWQLTTWSPPPPAEPSPPSLPAAAPPRTPSPGDATKGPPLPLPSESLDRRYTTRDNRDLWLGDIARPGQDIGTRDVDLAECQRQCTANNDCVAFAYDRWNRACYPKNRITQSLLDPHSTIAVKKPAELPSVSQKTFEMVILRNQRMRGDVNISKKTPDYASCNSACQDNIKCVTFNFLKRSGTADNCQMFNLSDGHDNDNTVDAGYKHQVP
jgi:Trypsin-like peptidase domain/PAN domain